MGDVDALDEDGAKLARRTKVRAAGELVITTGTVLGVVGGTLVGAAAPAGADPIHEVTSALDDDGEGLTLREAIAEAHDGDTITFNPSLTGATISLQLGDLEVMDKGLTIQGPGSGLLTIQASEADRAFYLYSEGSDPVTISGITIAGGDVSGTGGGILARGVALALDGVVLEDNEASGYGGGLAVDGAAGVTISGSTLSGNTASSGGGASIIYGGTVSITDTVISDNFAVNESTGKYLGAGLLLGRNGGGVEIVDTTISGNTSAGGGGGIAQLDVFRYAGAGAEADGPVGAAAVPGTLSIEGTTISGNAANGGSFGNGPGGGGGLWVGPGETDVQVVNSTISGNTAPNGAGGGVYAPFGQFADKYVELVHSTIVGNSALYGGGVAGDYSYSNPDRFTAQVVVDPEYYSSHVSADHTIIGNNSATEFGPDVAGGVEVRWSLVEDTDDGFVIGDPAENVFDRDPQLGGLADNGGPTLTHLPNAGSPVVNAGAPNVEAPETDQRGEDRIQGGRIDIGAVEGSRRSSLPVGPCAGAPVGAFTDVTSGNVHRAAVDCLAHLGITEGGPQGLPDDQYGPSLDVTRGQMASFLARLVEEAGGTLPAGPPDAFDDDDGTTHEGAINALAAAGIVEGFGDGTYRPGDPVRRDQMASFLLRTHDYLSDLTLAAGDDAFDDDEPGNVHEAAINALEEAGVIEGTGAPRVYDPAGDVRRDQMASFLIRLAQLLSTSGDFPTL